MRLSMVLLLTGALAWGCSSDEESANEPLAPTGEEASLGGAADMGLPASDPTTGGAADPAAAGGTWAGANETVPSAATEATPAATTTQPAAAAAATETWSVKAWALNVRKGPGVQHGKVRTLKKGQTVSALERSGNWVRIGNNEWVSASYLTK